MHCIFINSGQSRAKCHDYWDNINKDCQIVSIKDSL